MHRILLTITACLLLTISLSAQRLATWDGTDGDWNDATNWDMDIAPVAGDTVAFATNAIVGGTSTGDPVQIRIIGGAQVTLGLNLTVTGGANPLNTIVIEAGRLVFEDGFTFNLIPVSTGNGIQMLAGTMNIKGSATVNITGGNHGINTSNAAGNITARGTLNIMGASTMGIRHTAGFFENSGALTITSAGTAGIDNAAEFSNKKSTTTVLTITNAGNNAIKNKATGVFTNDDILNISGAATTGDGINNDGTFTNAVDGEITVSDMGDDGIEQVNGTFVNDGTITATAQAAATSGNNAISILGGSFTNTSNNSLNADGGLSGTGRAIRVVSPGALTNTGTITITGGDDANRINTGGTLTNDINGTIDLTDGRINNSGTLTNNGLILTTRASTGIFNTGTATNNAFFSYGGGNFSSAPLDDQGIDLNKGSSWRIDAGNLTTVKIANVPYTYEVTTNEIDADVTTDATGNLTISPATFSEVNVNLKPIGLSFPSGLKVRLQNATGNPSLPIELTSINAISMEKSIMVKWTTATETENDFMAVEHSVDGVSFREIGRVAGAGNSSVGANYELEDLSPVAGTNFYRLRQLDFDGTANYSQIVSADFDGETIDRTELRVYPTTLSAGQALRLDLRNVATTTPQPYQVIDANGRRVAEYLLSGGTVVELPLNNLNAGMYFLTTSLEGISSSARFIISGK